MLALLPLLHWFGHCTTARLVQPPSTTTPSKSNPLPSSASVSLSRPPRGVETRKFPAFSDWGGRANAHRGQQSARREDRGAPADASGRNEGGLGRAAGRQGRRRCGRRCGSGKGGSPPPCSPFMSGQIMPSCEWVMWRRRLKRCRSLAPGQPITSLAFWRGKVVQCWCRLRFRTTPLRGCRSLLQCDPSDGGCSLPVREGCLNGPFVGSLAPLQWPTACACSSPRASLPDRRVVPASCAAVAVSDPHQAGRGG